MKKPTSDMPSPASPTGMLNNAMPAAVQNLFDILCAISFFGMIQVGMATAQ
ncbi:hypothetical protein [Burkholderia aenigmatica]|uniref:hypothetical protein n=1 Tax=Burkholderia aenigmatica TaxID=2015348 RepID=UPI0026538601|nr:hypothetical protein [Burkholderia aenigmatica]MDN7877481.1 hypothetical protein [Burkholderia aenigmatica]